MYEPKIILSGAPNARDLGGIETKDGRTLKYGRLIRSGMLSRLDDNDMAYLKTPDCAPLLTLEPQPSACRSRIDCPKAQST